MSFAAILYVVLGLVSFALVAFFAWATWNGGKEERTGPAGTPEQPGPPPTPPQTPSAEPPRGPAGRV